MAFVPPQFHKYFWDVDPQNLTKEHKEQIIARLLEYGNSEAIFWCKEQFGEAKIKQILKTSRNLSKKSANFWTILFDISPQDVLCLQSSFRNKHRQLWNY